MVFRYDIGALRAIAVIAVFFYHFKIPFFDGGFVGVDIFFVISGYLMTHIILKGFQNNNFSYFKFIEKRVIRIVPPLLAISFFILFISSLLFYGNTVSQNARYVGQSITFLSNFYYMLSNNYFDEGSQNNIFIHSWSLSVEWQFYIVYPIVLLVLKSWYHRRIKRFRISFLLVTLLSFILCLVLCFSHNSLTFYMMPTRAWEMLLGGIAFLYANSLQKNLFKYKDGIVIVCLVILIICFVYFNESYTWPSAYALVPTLATFLIISLNSEFSFFKNPVIQFVGNISYSLYLWHWPLYIIFKYFALTDTNWIVIPILLSFLFASLTYYTLEKKCYLLNIKVIIALFLFTMALAVYLVKFPNNLLVKKIRLFNESYKPYFEYDQKAQFNSCNCFITDHQDYMIYNKYSCLSIDTTKANILLLGDSHSAQFSASFRKFLPDNKHLLELSAGFVFPFINARGSAHSVELISYFYKEFLPKNYDKIDKVFISVHWLMKNSPKMNYNNDQIKEELITLMALFARYKLDYSFIGQTEAYIFPFSKIVLGGRVSQDVYPSRYLDIEAFEMNKFLKSIIPKDKYIDIYDLKDIDQNSDILKMPYMFDKNHLTEFGADQYIQYLIKEGYFK